MRYAFELFKFIETLENCTFRWRNIEIGFEIEIVSKSFKDF